ncbi:hypothetical protein [Rhizobium rhizogenes]|uniref:hypothetical protein n=1 Tax=Rhizobium rhizogenes TaxID=359 RepID=UPI001F25F62A|nr:hypothetical protein [Rhizobium rhizogenes]
MADPSTGITIDEHLRPWLSDAMLRFRYLYPEIELHIDGDTVSFRGEDADDPSITRDFHFCLYRQKIFAETLPLRKMLIEGVTGFANRTP